VAGTHVESGYQDGDLPFGMMPAGQAIELVHEITPAGRIVTEMVAMATDILENLAQNAVIGSRTAAVDPSPARQKSGPSDAGE